MAYKGKVLTATVISGTSVNTNGICIQGANKVYFEIPAADTGVNSANVSIRCQVAQSAAGTYRPLKAFGIYSANSGVQIWEVWSSTGNYVCEVPAQGNNYLKVELAGANTVATAAGLACKVIVCS